MRKFTVLFTLLICASLAFGQNAQKLTKIQPASKVSMEKEKTFSFSESKKNVTVKSTKDDINEDIIWPTSSKPVTFDDNSEPWEVVNLKPTKSDNEWQVTDWQGVEAFVIDKAIDESMTNYAAWAMNLTQGMFNGGKAAWISVFQERFQNGSEWATTANKETESAIVFKNISFEGYALPKLIFRQTFERLNWVNTYVEWSTDGGTTWKSKEVNTSDNVPTFQLENNTLEVLLVGAGNMDDVQIRFRWLTNSDGAPKAGDQYGMHWLIDDIYAVEASVNDLVMEDARVGFFNPSSDYHGTGENDAFYFHTTAHYGQIPKLMLKTGNSFLYFHGMIRNYGSATVAPSMNVRILNPNGEEIYNENVTSKFQYGADEIKDTLDIWSDPDGTEPPAFFFDTENPDNIPLGEYKVIFKAFVDGVDDENPENNEMTLTFHVTETEYSRAIPRTEAEWNESDPSEGFMSLNRYTIGGANGDKTRLTYFYVGSGDTIQGITMVFHPDTKITNTAGDDLGCQVMFDLQVAGTSSLETIGSIVVDVPEGGKFTEMYIPFPDGEIPVRSAVDDGIYALYLQQTYMFYGGRIYFAAEKANRQSVFSFASQMVNQENPTLWYADGKVSPAISLKFKEKGNSVPSVEASQVVVYPNPTTGNLNIKNVQGATIEVINIMGQVVKTVSNANEIQSIDISNFANGNYFVKVIVDGKVTVEKINLAK